MDELSAKEKEIIEEAKKYALNAYSPYSKFSVGAAVLLDNEEITGGNNQENAAYPSGLCAERVAMFYANARYPKNAPQILAIAAKNEEDFTTEPISPCGACRQVLIESERRYHSPIKLLLYGTRHTAVVESASVLLPLSFSL